MSHLQSKPILGYNSGMESPVDIARGMERCLELGSCCPEIISLMSDDVRRLIAGLGAVEDAKGLHGLKDDICKVAWLPARSVIGPLLDNIERTDKGVHDRVFECINGIRFLANKALQIGKFSKPASDPVYGLWVCKMARSGSLGAKLLGAMGEKPAKTLFSAAELEVAIGVKDNGSNSTRNTLYEISAKSRGTDFELVIHRENDGSVRFFINLSLGKRMGKKEIEAEIFVKKVAPREGTYERAIARFLVKNFGKWFKAEEVASELGIEKGDFGKMIIGPLNRIAERCDRSGFRLKRRICHDSVSKKEYVLIKSS